jgi:hypothetical protein
MNVAVESLVALLTGTIVQLSNDADFFGRGTISSPLYKSLWINALQLSVFWGKRGRSHMS